MRLFLIFVFIAFSQDQYRKETLTTDDGLTSNSINVILQDKQGYMWVATSKSGLNQYDGYSIFKYRHNTYDSTSISSEYIYSLTEDSNGYIWIGTLNGLNRLDKHTQKIKRFFNEKHNLKSIPHNRINDVVTDKNGIIWVGTPSGIAKYNADSHTFTRVKFNNISTNSLYVRKIVHLNDSVVYLGLNSGLGIFNKYSNYLNIIKKEDLPYQYIRDLKYHKGLLWISRHRGIDLYNVVSKRFTNTDKLNKFQLKLIRHIGVSDSLIELSTPNGLYLINPSDNFSDELIYLKNDRRGNDITSSLTDNTGIKWIGTFGKGIIKLIPKIKAFKSWAFKPELTQLNDLFTDNYNNIWLGTNKGVFSPTISLNLLKGIAPIYKIVAMNQEDVWLLSKKSVILFRKNKLQRFTFHNGGVPSTPYFIKTFQDTLFVFSDNGIFIFDKKTSAFVKSDLFPKLFETVRVNDFIFLNNSYWIATNNGLYHYPTGEEKIFNIHYKKKTINVYSIQAFDNNTLWLCSPHGLYQYIISENSFRHFTDKDGLTDKNVLSLHKHGNNNFWVSTSNGLNKLFIDSNKVKINRFYKNDGLLDNEFLPAYTEDLSGKLYLATQSGLVSFYPSDVQLKPFFINPSITSIQTDTYKVNPNYKNPTKTIFSYGQNNLQIEFSAFTYNSKNPNVYLYQVKGIDKNWKYNGLANTVKLVNLSPGDYVFNLKAANKSGNWSKETYSFPFTIAPPFWQRWWFILGIFLVFLFMFYLIFLYKEKQRKHIEELRLRIATDLHDDVGASLTKIALYSESLQAYSSSDVSEKMSKNLIRIQDLSRLAISAMSDIVWAIDTRNNTIKDFLNKADDFIHESNDKLPVKIHFVYTGLNREKKILMEVRKNLFLILKEFVTNAIKYAGAENIYINIQNVPKFRMEIWDDGHSEKTSKKTGNGLRNIRFRAKQIGFSEEIQTHKGYKLILTGPAL